MQLLSHKNKSFVLFFTIVRKIMKKLKNPPEAFASGGSSYHLKNKVKGYINGLQLPITFDSKFIIQHLNANVNKKTKYYYSSSSSSGSSTL